MKSPRFIITLLIVFILSLVLCTSEPPVSVGGSGTDIICKVFTQEYDNVEGAIVTIKPKDYIPGKTEEDLISSFSGITDKDGKFIIDSVILENLTDSVFIISITNKDNTGDIRTVDLFDNRNFETVTQTSKTLRHFVLEPNGKASGHIVNGTDNKITNRAFVYIAGTDFIDTTDINGQYLLDSIPSGYNFTMGYYDLDDTSKTVEIDQVTIKSDNSTYLDTISLNGVVLLQLVNNFPHKLDTLYSLNTPKQNNYAPIGNSIPIKTPKNYNNFEFVNWELIYGSAEILSDSSDSATFILDSNSIIKANYRDIQAPDSVENVNIEVKGNQVTIDWSPSNDNDTIKEYCIIYRHQINTEIIDTFIYTDTIAFFEGLGLQNVTYTCTLKAVDPSGNLSKGTPLMFKTEKNDYTPPVFNSEIMIQKLNSTYATVYWNPAVDGLGIRKYEILLNDTFQVFKTELFYSGENLIPGKSFNIKIRAYDYYDNISDWIESDIVLPTFNDTLAPSVPIIDSSAVDGQEVYFSWKPAIDNVTDTVTYEIKYYPLDSSSTKPIFINLMNTTEYTLSNLKSNTQYSIAIRAYDLAWYYSDESTITVTTE